MYNLNSYLNIETGVKQTELIKIEQKQGGNVITVYIKAFAQGFTETLDADFGAAIEFAPGIVEEWMADYKYCNFWCKPYFGKNLSDIPDDTQGLIYKKIDGIYGVIIPLVSKEYKCVLCGTEEKIVAKLYSLQSGLNRIEAPAFVYAEGENPFSLLEECTAEAVKILNNGCRVRKERRYPEIFEYLGWCSWDAFEIRVTEQNLIDKCEEFKEKNIPVKWAIIDDMWAEVRDFYDIEYTEREEMFELMHASKLYSFKADPYRFPNGLKGCIDKIKDFGVKVGIWHPTTGYWRGIDPCGSLFTEMSDYLLRTNSGMYVHSFELDKAYKFYSDVHDYFKESGAEFVKIDNQSRMADCYKGLVTIGEAARKWHKAVEASVGEHFDGCMINCMGMSNEDMWNRSVSPISRCSDDFKPEDREWFAKHITQCAFNSLIQGQLYYSDWDMWWTDDAQAVKNSVLRAISGGPIYISDTLERSRAEILKPLAFDDGRILRCDRPALPTLDCLTQNPINSRKLFKVQNVCGNSGVIAVFNLDGENRPVKGNISPVDINGISGETFAVYEHFSREFVILDKEQKMELALNDADDFKLFIVVPIKDGFAPIGRCDKFISPKSIKNVRGKNIELIENGEYAYVEDGKLKIEKV